MIYFHPWIIIIIIMIDITANRYDSGRVKRDEDKRQRRQNVISAGKTAGSRGSYYYCEIVPEKNFWLYLAARFWARHRRAGPAESLRRVRWNTAA